MATPIEPAGAASAALNTQASAVQRPPQTQANTPAPVATETTRPAASSGDVVQTAQVNPNSRLGHFIDTTA
jgi:hypothetical protein